ncbi:MAG: hypothetical protein Q9210_006368 [Variospora velana]
MELVRACEGENGPGNGVKILVENLPEYELEIEPGNEAEKGPEIHVEMVVDFHPLSDHLPERQPRFTNRLLRPRQLWGIDDVEFDPNAYDHTGDFIFAPWWDMSRLRTLERVELSACTEALLKVYDLHSRLQYGERVPGLPQGLVQVIIRTDSAYMVLGMTERILAWEGNYYKTNRGIPIENADLYWPLNQAVCALECRGVTVLFWLVTRGRNAEAIALA